MFIANAALGVQEELPVVNEIHHWQISVTDAYELGFYGGYESCLLSSRPAPVLEDAELMRRYEELGARERLEDQSMWAL